MSEQNSLAKKMILHFLCKNAISVFSRKLSILSGEESQQWERTTQAFMEANKLKKETLLSFPYVTNPFHLSTEASDKRIA